MSAPQSNAQPQPRSLSGTLAKTPLPRLLVSASNARVTGTLVLTAPNETASLMMVRGLVTKVKTSAPVSYLGSILYELGYIESDELNDSLRELARTKWLHGEILLTRAVISPAQLAEGLHEQTTRKLVHLFSLPPETSYAFEADVDHLSSYGGTDFPSADPIAAVWRGVRDGFAQIEIEEALSRVKEYAFRLANGTDCKRYDLSDAELTAIECLRARALTEEELTERAGLDPARARALLYFLLVTRRAEPTEVSGVRKAYVAPPTMTTPSVRPNLRPTLREMAAVGSNPRISVAAPEITESGRWRAVVAPSAPPTSGMIPSTPAGQTPESGMIRIAGRHASSTASSAVSPSVSPRLTVRGVAPGSAPPRHPGLTPPQAWTPSAPPARDPAPPSRATTSTAPRSIAPGSFTSPRSVSAAAAAPQARPVTPAAPPATSFPVSPAAQTSPSTRPRSVSPGAPPPLKRSATPHPSTASFNAKVVVELAARRQSIFERARAILKEDHFQRLSLPRDASSEQIELAFQALRTLWDPALLPPALEEAQDDAAFVMSCLNEAHATLVDPRARSDYAMSLTTAALRAPTEQLEEDLASTGAADLFEGAKIAFARNELERAERLCKRAFKENAESGGALALLAWIEATKPQNTTADETRRRIAMLDRALRLDPTMAEGFHWRGQLHKRIENHSAAMRDFRRVLELAPKHMEAVRELRVYEMRIRRNSISMKAVK